MDISAITIAGLTVYEIVWFFMIYSFLGWVLEVIYHAVSIGKVVNRGFLNGPVCPIYGFGMIFILMLLNLIFPGGAAKAHGAALFAFGIVIATGIELLGGWALEKICHARWWDYSDKPFNLNGYICPEFSFYWGIGTVLAVRVLHPFVADTTVNIWPKQIAWPVAIVLCCAYAADTVVTVMIVNGLNKELAELDDLRSSMRKVSDDLSNVLGTTSIKTIQRIEKTKYELIDALPQDGLAAFPVQVIVRQPEADGRSGRYLVAAPRYLEEGLPVVVRDRYLLRRCTAFA